MFQRLGVVRFTGAILGLSVVLQVFGIDAQAGWKKKRCKHSANTFRCVAYVSNIDGDTIRFNIPKIHPLLGDNIAIRVKGINTPEIGKAKDACEREAGIRARLEVKRIMENAKTIELRNYKRGSFFRIVADVYVNGRSLGNHLLKERYAVKFQRKAPDVDWCHFY